MEREKFMKDFFYNKNSKLSVEEFDAFVLEDLQKANLRAKRLLGVEDSFANSFNPIAITTPALANGQVAAVFVYAEEKLRYDLAQHFTLLFGDRILFYYSCVIDHKTGSAFNDRAVEIPYSKIKTIETISKFTYIDKVEHHVFQITIAVDELENIVLPLRILMVDEDTPKEDYLLSPEIVEISSNLKKFLRTKLK